MGLGRQVADVIGDEIVEQRRAERVAERRELLAHAARDAQQEATLIDGQAVAGGELARRGEQALRLGALDPAREDQSVLHPALDRFQGRRFAVHACSISMLSIARGTRKPTGLETPSAPSDSGALKAAMGSGRPAIWSFALSNSAWQSTKDGISPSHSSKVEAPPVRSQASRNSSHTSGRTGRSWVSMMWLPRC